MARGSGFTYSPRDEDPTKLVTYAEARGLWMRSDVVKGRQRLHLYSPRGYLVRLVGHGRAARVEGRMAAQHQNADPWQVLLLSPEEEVLLDYFHITGTGAKNRNWNFVRNMLFRFEELPIDQQFVSRQDIQDRLKERETKTSDAIAGAILDRLVVVEHDNQELRDRVAVVEERWERLRVALLGPLQAPNTASPPLAPPEPSSPLVTMVERRKSNLELGRIRAGAIPLENAEVEILERKLKTVGILNRAVNPPVDDEVRALEAETKVGFSRVKNWLYVMEDRGLVELVEAPEAKKSGTSRTPMKWVWVEQEALKVLQ